jgi:hypothetical protein
MDGRSTPIWPLSDGREGLLGVSGGRPAPQTTLTITKSYQPLLYSIDPNSLTQETTHITQNITIVNERYYNLYLWVKHQYMYFNFILLSYSK